MTNNKQPEIRFAGFEDLWKIQILRNIVERVTRKNKDLITQLPLTISAQHGLVDQVSYFNKQVASKDMSNYYLLEKGEFAYNKSYSRDYPWGAIKRLDKYEKGALSTLYITFKPSKVDSEFLVSYYDTNRWHKEVSIRATEGARNHGLLNISANDFLETELKIPSEEEQVKIGSFFKEIDDTISLHQQELTILKQSKQGFLQKMFPKEGETIPEIRFPGFSGEWKETEFKYLAEIRRGLTYKPTDVEPTGVRVLRSSNINGDRFVLRHDDIYVNPKAINIEFVKENEILITSANGSSKLVGKHALIKNAGDLTVHGGFMLIASAQAPYFVNALMSSAWYDKFIHVYVSGGNGAIGNLNKNDLEKQTVLVPELEEQIKIGEFFKHLDETIELHEKELEALKETKKAFLQKMFV